VTFRVRFDHARIDGEPFAADQFSRHASTYHVLEYMTEKKIALAKASVPILRKCRVIRNRAFEAQTTEPALGEIEMHLLAQPTFGPDAE
jgi:hypothetical protein